MQKKFPLVSIVIPTFNQGTYLPACIDHCLFQTYPNLEIIIVDGGSDDGTKAYLRSLEERIKNTTIEPVTRMSNTGDIVREKQRSYHQGRKVKILMCDEDIGTTPTYNVGLAEASGKYCTYIVGDDLPHSHMIEEMVSVLIEKDVNFVYSDMNVVDDAGCIIRQIRLLDYDFKKCLADWFHLGVSKLYRTNLHERVGLMDEAYQSANDYDHYLRFAMAGATFYHLPRILYSVRFHGDHRQSGQHTPERRANLMKESSRCALRARKWLAMKARIND